MVDVVVLDACVAACEDAMVGERNAVDGHVALEAEPVRGVVEAGEDGGVDISGVVVFTAFVGCAGGIERGTDVLLAERGA